MGAWSEENFGNDDAGDWVYQLEKSRGTETLLSPIKDIIASDDYLESPQCCEALAAAEVVAASLTGDLSAIPEELKVWLNRKPGLFGKKPKIEPQHASIAIQCVQKILVDSELRELWEESEDYAKWQAVQNRLITKLEAI